MEAAFNAAMTNDVTSLRKLLHLSGSSLLDTEDGEGKTPITIAIERNSIECVKWLIENGCRLAKAAHLTEPKNASDNIFSPPVPNGLIETDSADSFYPPLLAAVISGSLEIATLLLDSGRVQIEDRYRGTTALLRACTDGCTEMVAFLISHGANVNGWPDDDSCFPSDSEHKDPNVWEYQPLYYAVQHGHGDTVKILAQNGARYISHCPVPCYSFWQPHSWRASNNILQRCWGSILELAALKCRSKVAFLLNFFNKEISTLEAFQTLVQCVVAEDLELTEILLDACLKRTAPDSPAEKEHPYGDSFWTVIKLAVRKCREGKEDIPLLLLQRSGSLVDDATLLILLDLAVLRNLPRVVTKLAEMLNAHNDKEALESDILRAVRLQDVAYTALSQGNLTIIQILVEKGLMDLKEQPSVLFEVLTPHGCYTDIGKLLNWLVVEQGCDPGACNEYGLEPIHVAVKEQMPEAIKSLCSLGVDANAQAQAEDLLSPLQMHLNLCILQLGISPNVRLMEVLIEHGADLAMKNRQGYTPLSLLFWLTLAWKQGSVSHQAVVNVSYKAATISSMKYFPLNAAFVRNSDPEACDEASGSSSSEEETENSSDEDDSEEETDSFSSDFNDETAVRSDERARDSTVQKAHNDHLLPRYLQASEPQRAFIEQVVNKFGLSLLSLGADSLTGSKRWHRMDKFLLLAGINSKHTPSLKNLCWRAVRSRLGSVHFQQKVDQLPLPTAMKEFLKKV